MKKIFIFCLFVCSIVVGQGYSYNYDEMQKEEYDAELLKWRNKLSIAEEGLKKATTEIESLKPELASHNEETDSIWAEIYALASEDGNGTKDTFEEYMEKVNQLRNDVSSFLAQSSDEIYRNRREIDAFQKRLDFFKEQNESLITRAETALASIQSMIEQARNKAKLPNSMYEVERGDNLWNIAKKDAVFGDPYAWVRIYDTNKGQIKDPDLIFPKQVFSISRSVGADQYLIKRGDTLFKIAGDNGNSFSWMKLYNANKDLVSDPNIIMPYKVLTLPR